MNRIDSLINGVLEALANNQKFLDTLNALELLPASQRRCEVCTEEEIEVSHAE